MIYKIFLAGRNISYEDGTPVVAKKDLLKSTFEFYMKRGLKYYFRNRYEKRMILFTNIHFFDEFKYGNSYTMFEKI